MAVIVQDPAVVVRVFVLRCIGQANVLGGADLVTEPAEGVVLGEAVDFYVL